MQQGGFNFRELLRLVHPWLYVQQNKDAYSAAYLGSEWVLQMVDADGG